MKQSVRVQIFNQAYTLLADDNPAALQELAHRVDDLMSSIAARSGSGDSTRVAVLACLHLADKLREYEEKSEEIGSMLDRALR